MTLSAKLLNNQSVPKGSDKKRVHFLAKVAHVMLFGCFLVIAQFQSQRYQLM